MGMKFNGWIPYQMMIHHRCMKWQLAFPMPMRFDTEENSVKSLLSN